MARSLEDFVGTYTIRHGQGSLEMIQRGYKLCIGTGTHGDPQPDGIRVGLAIVEPPAQRVLPPPDQPPVFAYLVDGTLNGSAYWLGDQQKPQLLTYQISLMTLRELDGGVYNAVTILVSIDDPQNAGVWGADDESGG